MLKLARWHRKDQIMLLSAALAHHLQQHSTKALVTLLPGPHGLPPVSCCWGIIQLRATVREGQHTTAHAQSSLNTNYSNSLTLTICWVWAICTFLSKALRKLIFYKFFVNVKKKEREKKTSGKIYLRFITLCSWSLPHLRCMRAHGLLLCRCFLCGQADQK